VSATTHAVVATIGGEMKILLLEDGAIGLRRRQSPIRSGHILKAEDARELVELLDRALAEGAADGVLGSVSAGNGATGRRCDLHVIKWGSASVSLREDVQRHGDSWTLRMRDEVETVRDALGHVAHASEALREAPAARAAAGEAIAEGEVAELLHAHPSRLRASREDSP